MNPETTDTVTIPEVARRLGVSDRTVQRREAELLSVGAVKTGNGWMIPRDKVDDLIHAITSRRHQPLSTSSPRRSESLSDEVVALKMENSQLKATVEQQRERITFLETQNTTLIETNRDAVTSNATIALAMRESLKGLPTPVERVETPHESPQPRTSRLARFFHVV